MESSVFRVQMWMSVGRAPTSAIISPPTVWTQSGGFCVSVMKATRDSTKLIVKVSSDTVQITLVCLIDHISSRGSTLLHFNGTGVLIACVWLIYLFDIEVSASSLKMIHGFTGAGFIRRNSEHQILQNGSFLYDCIFSTCPRSQSNDFDRSKNFVAKVWRLLITVSINTTVNWFPRYLPSSA